jgi:EAL domain-containing protein (putative c-di-GMP-specific phosphodiesterase class I)
VRRADIAMYDAKEQKEHWRSYERGRDERYLKRLELISDLRHAGGRGEFSMNFQPKIDVDSRKVVGLEALLRWHHPTRGAVPPDEFIPLAEQTGNIGQITDWVLRHVIYSCRDWAKDGWQPTVALNLSPLDLMNDELPAQLAQLLEVSGVPAKQLILEITEGAIMRDIVHAREVMRRLKRIGVGLSIDDFGTGYSSLGQLRHLPVDELKIDRSFLMTFKDGGSEDAAIVKSIIELAHNLGLRVTAEGVETDACMIFLKQHRCDLAQGYFISKPLTHAALMDWKSNYIRSRSA